MPSGKVHNLINTLALVALAGGYGLAVEQKLLPMLPDAALAFAVAFAAGTFLLSPDLDLAEQSVGPKKAWGPLGVLWVPYGMVMTHRGTSHSWVIGPLTRLLYLAALLLLLVALPFYGLSQYIQIPLNLDWSRFQPQSTPLLAMLAGYYISQWLHLMADGMWPDLYPPALTALMRRGRQGKRH
jgi:uncharacterized metal-binding protein